MKFSKNDKTVLLKALTEREQYKIVVDNECVSLCSTDDDSDYFERFEDYGE